jgi:thiamine-phosphate pyrophosphorylase
MRDTQQDVGTTISTPTETSRADSWDVCVASCERVKQSLRSLEEFIKTTSPESAARFEALRYRWYTLEKTLTHTSRLRLSDTNLCVLIDGQTTLDIVHQLIEAGVGMIQLREKNLSDRELLERARFVCEAANVPRQDGGAMCLVIINDRPDIAAANADGVHLGQDDLPVREARRILGPRKIIGVSTHTIEQARAAVLDGADYIGVGPTFSSTTKTFDTFPGTALLKQVADEISLPAFAIGGITLENLSEVLATGINRVAVSGAIAKAEKPGEVANRFIARL